MDTFANKMTNYLLTQSWQIALLAVIVGLITFALRNKSAHIRYLLWLIVLAKCLVPPIYSVPVAVLPERKPIEHSLHAEIQLLPIENSAVTDRPEPVTIEKMPQPRRRQFELPGTKQTIVLLWLAGIVLFLSWIGTRAVRYTLWLCRRRLPLPLVLDQQFRQLFTGFKFKKSPKIWLASDIAQPFVWGLFRGSVYLPADFTDLDRPQHHRTVLVHELSHVARFDAAANVLQILAQAIFWFHPFVWWVNKKIRAEREKCCDEMSVAHLSAAPEHYTDAIVEALAAERLSAHPVPSLAIVGSVKDIEERIKTMLRPGKKFYKRPSFKIATVLILLAVLIVPISCTLTHRAKIETTTEQAEKSSKSLFDAIWDGDSDEVKRLIANGVDVNTTDPDVPGVNFTPLMATANGGFAKVAKVLLENGAEVNATDFQGWTALYYAFWLYAPDDNEEKHRERAELVKALIAAGADVNKKNQGISPLINAITTGTPRLGGIEAMLDAGADIHFKDNRGLTPLYYAAFSGDRDVLDLILERGDYPETIHLAACRGDVDKVQAFLDQGMNVNAKDEFGCTLLHWAARAKSPEVARLLIAKGADVNVTAGPDVMTPLLAARQLPIIELLISAGADIRSRENLSKLHDACSAGDIELVRFLIDKGADVNARNRRGATPLYAAAGGNHKEVVELLLNKGADINAPGRGGATPLWTAVRNFCEETAEFLIEKGASINTPDNSGVTPLDVAEQRESIDMVELLQKHGAKKGSPNLLQAVNSGNIGQVIRLISQDADVNLKNNNGQTLLHLACQRGNKEIARLLIDNGADINVKNNRGQTPLDLAGQRGHTEIVELLKKHGAKEDSSAVKIENNQAKTLHQAAAEGDIECVKQLIAEGADVNANEGDGTWTPLVEAANRGHSEIVKILLANGADVEKGDGYFSPLYYAIWSEDNATVKALIDGGANVNILPEREYPPVLHAIWQAHVDIVKTLLDAGATLDHKDDGGCTPLYNAAFYSSKDVLDLILARGSYEETVQLAASRGQLEKVKAFIAEGADVNTKDAFGCTLLHWAVLADSPEVAEFLIAEGADLNVKDNSASAPISVAKGLAMVKLLVSKGADIDTKALWHKRTRLYMACSAGEKDLVEFLINAGADIHAKTNRGREPLHTAAGHGHVEIAELLIAKGADVNVKSGIGARAATPLWRAASNGRVDMVRFLLDKGADINAPNHQGQTPLAAAKQQGHTEVVNILRQQGAK